MLYRDEYFALAPVADSATEASADPAFEGLGVRLRSFELLSGAREFLPGALAYRCPAHGQRFDAAAVEHGTPVFQPGDGSLHMPDCDIESNFRFRCLVMEPATEAPRGVILLLHGLNEKRWDKYLPWALRLVRGTGKAVLLFPISFHMNRTPAPWFDARRMARVSDERRHAFPTLAGSSLANAAISSRLHMMPQRFFWSGLQAYEDVRALLTSLRGGGLAGMPAVRHADIFAYSIGAFLAEILLMADEDGLFTGSRLFLFCGGPTLDRMNPTSRYILDSEATIALYSYFNQHLDNEFQRDPRLAHYFGEGHPAGRTFRSMLSYHTLREERERRFDELATRIRAVALRADTVIPPGEVLATLQGSYHDIPIPVDVLDFPHPYSHISPFPTGASHAAATESSFSRVMDLASMHLTA